MTRPLKPCQLVNAPNVLPGWACCICHSYNGLQRDGCKYCGHRCCFVKPKPEEFGLCNTCGVPKGMAHVGHTPEGIPPDRKQESRKRRTLAHGTD